MPWAKKAGHRGVLKGRKGFSWPEPARSAQALATLEAARLLCLLIQGIGLRPQPWAEISRPLGPQRP